MALAEEFTGPLLTTAPKALEAAKYCMAMQIARDPIVYLQVRDTLLARATITIRPTKKGTFADVSGVGETFVHTGCLRMHVDDAVPGSDMFCYC